jgi:Zn-dependent protease
VNTSFDPLTVLFFVATLVPSIVLHELAHGLMADRLGDPTPRAMGRLTLNPIKHADPFGSVILPGLLLLPYLFGRGTTVVFGYAKPMPVNPANLKHPDRQMMTIALVGPVTNLVLAVLGALVLRFLGSTGGPVAEFLFTWILLNVILAVFNLMPIPPLDGSKVVARFLPPRAREVYRSMDAYGALFMLLIFFLFPGVFFAIVRPVVSGLLTLLVV